MPAALLYGRRLALLVVLALPLVFLLHGCDSLGPAPDTAPDGLLQVPSGTEDLPFTRIPDGGRLAPPGTKSDGVTSPYGCLLSTPNLAAGADTTLRYLYDAVYLHFPDSIATAAGDSVRPVSIWLDSRVDYTDAPRAVPTVVRVADCRLPPGKAAFDLTHTALWHLPPDAGQTWDGAPADDGGASGLKSGGLGIKAGTCVRRTTTYECGGDDTSGGNDDSSGDDRPNTNDSDGPGGPPVIALRVGGGTVAGAKATCAASTIFCVSGPTGGGPGGGTSGGGPSGGTSGGGPSGGTSGDGSAPSGCDGGATDPTGDLCTSGGDDPTTGDQTAGIGKAIKVGRKMLDAARRGDDLLDVRTWKRIGREEWDELVGCGIDALDATSGDPVALASCLNCAASLTLGVDFFDMLQALKLGDRLGLPWYDDVIGALHRSPLFPQLAQAIGDFANTIDDLGVLKQVGQLDVEDNGAYRILEGDAGKVLDNFAERWGTTVRNIAPDRWQVTSPDGATILTHYPSGTTPYPTIQINESGATQKVRFGSSIYYAN